MINSILLTNFTGFANNRFDFTEGVNVLIGKNGTGKTHVLKCLAATLQARHDFLGKNSASKEQFEYILAEDMIYYFKPDIIGNLVSKGLPSGRANIAVTIDSKVLQYSFSSAAKTTVKLETDEKWNDRHFIYIPPREMFSLFEGFIGLSSKREISFDQTYINLAHALALPVLRESEDNPLRPAVELLERELQFKVLQMNGRFYIQTESGNMADLGYGCKAFTISLVENAVKVSHGKVEANVIAQIVDLGKSLLHLDAKPLEGVEKTLACFREMKKYKLAVFTKGELMDQENKLWRSGLQRYFDVVTIVSDKTPKAYHRLCRELDVRGNIGAMFQAALDAGGAAAAYYAPALPQMNRLTRGGIQYIDGVPIDKSVFGQDPFEPVHSPYVKDLFRNCRAAIISCGPRALPPPPQHGQQIVICDAEKDTDFRCIAMELQRTNGLKILGGCAGFAAVLPPFLGLEGGPISLPCINAPLLVLCGSLNPITKRQLEYGAAHGGVRISLQSEQLAAGYFESRAGQDFLTQIEQRMQGGCDMLIDTDGTDTAEDADTAEQLRGQIAEQLGLLMALLLERPAADHYLPMIIGGDTLMGFMQQLPEAEISPLGEAAPGAVLFTAPMATHVSRIIVSKSGGFGDEDLLSRIRQNLQKGTEDDEAVSTCHAAAGI